MNFDSLEPYGLCVSLIIAVPTIFLGSYVYFRIWRSADYRKSQYLRLYSFKSLNELVLYSLSIFIMRLPSQNFTHSFYKNIADSYFVWICAVIAHICNFAPYSFGVLLSINRFYAISKMEMFTKDGYRRLFKTLALIYVFPVILSIRHVIYRPYFSEFNGQNGLVFFFHTPSAHIMFDIFEFGFYGLTLVFEFILNIATLYSLFRNDNVKILRTRVKKQAEIGLYVTTICNFLLTSLFVIQKIFIEFFPFSEMIHSISMVAHVITMDAMCIVPVYLLIAFSPMLRSQIFTAHFKKNEVVVSSSRDSQDM